MSWHRLGLSSVPPNQHPETKKYDDYHSPFKFPFRKILAHQNSDEYPKDHPWNKLKNVFPLGVPVVIGHCKNIPNDQQGNKKPRRSS